MDEDDNEMLLKSLDNEGNKSIMNLSKPLINKTKNDILQKLQLSREKLKETHVKLKEYRYIEEVNDINYGSYIRWINLKNPANIKLENGGMICDIKILNDGVHVLCKNFRNRMMQIKLDECLMFQKLTSQENIILTVLEYLHK